jgi:hypothetical protein
MHLPANQSAARYCTAAMVSTLHCRNGLHNTRTQQKGFRPCAVDQTYDRPSQSAGMLPKQHYMLWNIDQLALTSCSPEPTVLQIEAYAAATPHCHSKRSCAGL